MLNPNLICAIIILSWQARRFFCVYSQNNPHKLNFVGKTLCIPILWKHKNPAVCQDAEGMQGVFSF